MSMSNHIIFSKDTDTWVCSLALMEIGFLISKNTLIKRSCSDEYVSINLGIRTIIVLSNFCTIKNPQCVLWHSMH